MKLADVIPNAFQAMRTGLMVLTAGIAAPMAVAVDNREGWTPPSPVDLPTEFDWVQLPSGEWLGGELIALYEGVLEFDSEEMGVAKLDWDDVLELRTAQVLRVRPNSGVSATGQVLLKDGLVSVLGSQTVVFEQSEVLTVTAGVEREINYWSGEVSGNLNSQSGNSDSQSFNIRALAQRRTAEQRIVTEYIGNYDETDGEETKNNHRISVDWDRFVTDRFFWSPVSAEYYKDRFKNIDHRFSLGPAVGYQLIDTAETSWSVRGGPAYTQTWFDQVETGEDDSVSSAALFGGTRVDHELTGDIDLWYDYRFLLASRDTGGYSHRMEFGSSIDIFGDLDLRASYVWDYISDPGTDEAGNTPDQNDGQFLIGIGYSF